MTEKKKALENTVQSLENKANHLLKNYRFGNTCMWKLIMCKLYFCHSISKSALHGWLSGFEFDTQLRRTFFPTYFRLSPLLKHVREVVGGIGKKLVITGVRKPGNTCVSSTTMMRP